MKLYDVKNTELYWTKAVEDFFRLGLEQAVVPASNIDYDTVKMIATRLDLAVEIKNTDYIFHRNRR